MLESVPLEKIINLLKKHTGLSHLQLGLARGATLSTEIKSVALCAGSGASLLRGIKADLYLTGLYITMMFCMFNVFVLFQ